MTKFDLLKADLFFWFLDDTYVEAGKFDQPYFSSLIHSISTAVVGDPNFDFIAGQFLGCVKSAGNEIVTESVGNTIVQMRIINNRAIGFDDRTPSVTH